MNPKDLDRPFEEILAECTALAERMDDLLGGIEPLSTSEVRAMLKLRKGGDAIIRALAEQCEKLAITRAGHVSVEDMTRAMDRAQAVRSVLERVELVHARLDSSRLRAASASWSSAMTFYALLRSLSARDPSVKEGLANVVAFFKPRPKRKGYFPGG
jgi:hypothetical protein